MLVIFNKPYGVLSQFTSDGKWQTLAAYLDIARVYPAGRLDADSEGLLLLTDNGALQAAIAGSRSVVAKTYWAQVEGEATEDQARQLRAGVLLRDGPTRPAGCELLGHVEAPWHRHPPIRVRKTVLDCWLALTLTEGRNRQVRRMTAHVGLPTLRLIRMAIGPWSVAGLQPGEYRVVSDDEAFAALRGLPGSKGRGTCRKKGGREAAPRA